MQWTIIKAWAKEKGYETSRKKLSTEEKKYEYHWLKIEDPQTCGVTTSITKLATTLFNQLTNNQYIEYQAEYKKQLIEQDIDHNELSGGW